MSFCVRGGEVEPRTWEKWWVNVWREYVPEVVDLCSSSCSSMTAFAAA
jgi:hypothetical protein